LTCLNPDLRFNRWAP